jgi:hypothetical protein
MSSCSTVWLLLQQPQLWVYWSAAIVHGVHECSMLIGGACAGSTCWKTAAWCVERLLVPAQA